MNGLNSEARDELLSLSEQNDGVLMPESVVSAAKAKSSPLHSYFTWDDTAAARKQRLYEARQLIACVVEYVPQVEREVRAFVSIASERPGGGGYRRTVRAMSDAAYRKEMLDMALQDLQRCEERYAAIRELQSVWAAAGAVRKRVKVKKKRRQPAKA